MYAGGQGLITIVTTVTTMATLGLTSVIGKSLSVIAVVTLIVFLATREVTSTGNSRFSLQIAKFASVGILPLIMAFAAIAIMKIAEML